MTVITDDEVRAVAARDGDEDLVEQLEQSLAYARRHGQLPPRNGSPRQPDPDRPCHWVVID